MENIDSINVTSISKCFEIYTRSEQRLLSYFFRSAKSKRRDFWALKNISFSLKAGQTLGIVGRNGSGKSTLLQIICGTLTPTSGTVTLNGKVAALLELGAGFNPEFSGRENIILNASIYGLTPQQIQERIDAIISFAEIEEFIDQPVKHYSSGMFVRLAFSVIAHVDADVLIIDEALAVGDALFSQKCMRFLDEFKEHGSIIFVSHDSGAITKLCDKAIWLDRGELKMFDQVRPVMEAYFEHLYAAQQNVISTSTMALSPEDEPIAHHSQWVDQRQTLIDHSTFRNDIEIFRFDTSAAAFGTGKVSIDDVYIISESDERLSWVVGGRRTRIVLEFTASEIIHSVIVGFLIKDRLGQVLFGDNNCLLHQFNPVTVYPKVRNQAIFEIMLPFLPEGEYVVAAAVASGTQHEHIQHCWRHDALVMNVVASPVVHGLLGVPLISCSIQPAIVASSLND